MTNDDYERETEAMLDVLILYPNDLLELVAYVAEDTAKGSGTAIPGPSFGGTNDAR